MLNYRIIENKNVINNKGENYIDLLSNTFDKSIIPKGELLVVNKYYIARPDLISLACYGTDEYADIICKLNGISNPFEMNENDILFIPEIDYLHNCVFSKGHSQSDVIKQESDEIYVNASTYQKKKNEKRSPNEQTIGEKTFTIDKSLGIVFY